MRKPCPCLVSFKDSETCKLLFPRNASCLRSVGLQIHLLLEERLSARLRKTTLLGKSVLLPERHWVPCCVGILAGKQANSGSNHSWDAAVLILDILKSREEVNQLPWLVSMWAQCQNCL